MQELPIYRYKTTTMQRIQQLSVRGYHWYTSGTVPHSKAQKLAIKFDALYGISCNENQRSYRQKKASLTQNYCCIQSRTKDPPREENIPGLIVADQIPHAGIDVNVHNEALNASTNGYPAIFDAVSEKVTSDSSAKDIQQKMLDAVKLQVQQGKLKNGDAEKVKKAIGYMLHSFAANAPIMEYPKHILLKNVLINTWDFIAENTANNNQQQEAIETLFEQFSIDPAFDSLVDQAFETSVN